MKVKRDSCVEFRVGDLVQVRSEEEILATLDAQGNRDALPFMPEMLQYCGQRFRVYKRAHKTCDTIRRPRSLRMSSAVHLENVRCDGGAHGGCQAGCLIFWKEAWLKPVVAADGASAPLSQEASRLHRQPVTCTKDALLRATRRVTGDQTESDAEVFSCQAIELLKATSPVGWWDIRQYLSDVTSGNVSLADCVRGMSIAAFNMIVRNVRRSLLAIHQRLSRPASASPSTHGSSTGDVPRSGHPAPGTFSIAGFARSVLTNVFVEYPHVRGTLTKTPSAELNLQRGDLVQVRSKAEIMATLDLDNRNRGLSFDVEMVRYCGGTFPVQRRVERILNEKTGRMLKLSNSCIVLEGVVCRGCSSSRRLFCPRSIPQYWHEIWLKRAETVSSPSELDRAGPGSPGSAEVSAGGFPLHSGLQLHRHLDEREIETGTRLAPASVPRCPVYPID